MTRSEAPPGFAEPPNGHTVEYDKEVLHHFAVDRPLSASSRKQLRTITSRATIISTRLVNIYEWGDFKGDPHQQDPRPSECRDGHDGRRPYDDRLAVGG